MAGLANKIKNFTSPTNWAGAAFDRWVGHLQSRTDRPIQEIQNGSLGVLQSRSRALWRDSDIAKGAIECFVTNVVGAGVQIYPRIRGANNKLMVDVNRRVRDLWLERQEHISVVGDNFLEFTTQAMRTFKLDGEHYLLRVMHPDVNKKFQREYMTIEGNQLAVDANVAQLDNPHKNPINLGIETDEFGRRVAYHVAVDRMDNWAQRGIYRKYVRIPAERVSPLTELNRYGSLRGLPMLVAAILLVADCGELRHATLAKAWLHASFTAVATDKDPVGLAAEMPDSRVSGAAQSAFPKNSPDVVKSEALGFEQLLIDSGMILRGGKELKIDLLDSKTPPAQYAPFDAAMLRGVSRETGLSPIAILRETQAISYSTFRGWLSSDLLLYKQTAEQFDPRVITPVWRDFINEVFIEKHHLPMPDTENLYAAKVQHPRARDLDPREEKSFTEAMSTGTLSPETKCAIQGLNIYEELDSRKEVIEYANSIELDPSAFFGMAPVVTLDSYDEIEDDGDVDTKPEPDEEDTDAA